MIEIDTANYDRTVRIRNGDRAVRFDLPHASKRRYLELIAAIVRQINEGLKLVQK